MSENQEKLNEQLFNVVADEKVSCEAMLKKVKYLVRLGADVNTRLYGKSLLSKAIEKEVGAEVQEFLREKGAIQWVISKEEALELSQGFWDDEGDFKSLEEIKELLKKGADLEAKDGDGRTALMMAANWGELDVVKFLVEHGADVNAKGEGGRTALMYVASNGCFEAVVYLVENGADLEAKNKFRRTALMIAKNCKRDDCVEFLEEAQKKNSARKNQGDKTSASQIVKANEGR